MAKVNYKVGDVVTLKSKRPAGWAQNGAMDKYLGMTVVISDIVHEVFEFCGSEPWVFMLSDIETLKTSNMNTKQLKEQAIRETIVEICQPNNTFTTLELKLKLIAEYPDFRWVQDELSSTNPNSVVAQMLSKSELIVVDDNGSYKTYALPNYSKTKSNKMKKTASVTVTVTKDAKTSTVSVSAAKPRKPDNRISRTKAYDMMKNNKGRFFTATFVKKDGTERTINCQFLKDQSELNMGYVKVRESSKLKTNPNDCTRQINLQTLKRLKIAGVEYKIRS